MQYNDKKSNIHLFLDIFLLSFIYHFKCFISVVILSKKCMLMGSHPPLECHSGQFKGKIQVKGNDYERETYLLHVVETISLSISVGCCTLMNKCMGRFID